MVVRLPVTKTIVLGNSIFCPRLSICHSFPSFPCVCLKITNIPNTVPSSLGILGHIMSSYKLQAKCKKRTNLSVVDKKVIAGTEGGRDLERV
jgi:hypothetical protein